MASLEYNKDGRLLFTKEMKNEYTLLVPNMLPIHFKLFKGVFELHGYKVVLLETDTREIVNEGLRNVHNDTCYPALLVIGQLLHALKSGEYDLNKTGVMISQTGGGCRASNYIHLLRKALKKSGFENIPVVSLNLSGMEKNPGFKLSPTFLIRLIYCLIYGDLIMCLANQTRAYETVKGSTDELINQQVARLTAEFQDKRFISRKKLKKNLNEITARFAALPIRKTEKIKVGIVGEIYVKYAPLGNNNLEKFLESEDTEIVIPGLMGFMLLKVDNRKEDPELYGGARLKHTVASALEDYMLKVENDMIEAVVKYPQFTPPPSFVKTKELVRGYVGYGNKMGEGWLLTAEMIELIHNGVDNIVCTQPFGCLPNHVVGKGMIRKIKEENPTANIVAIDYDPGATAINQENRIKLMIANAKYGRN